MVKPRAHRKPSKAEIAKRAALQQAALAWPTYPDPTPLSAEECDALLAAQSETGGYSEQVVPAWTFHTSGHGEILYGCFARNYHSTRSHTQTTTQGRGGPWYRTKSEAAMALRWAIARECAARLARVDELFADTLAGRQDTPAN